MGTNPLAPKITRRRKELRLSQQKAADLAGVHRLTWRAWENGSTPEDYNYAGIERALRWEAGSVEVVLAGGDPVPVPDEPERDLRSDPDYQEWIAGYRRLRAKGFGHDEALTALTDEEQQEVQDAHRTDHRRDAG